jgi:hypothetical protein
MVLRLQSTVSIHLNLGRSRNLYAVLELDLVAGHQSSPFSWSELLERADQLKASVQAKVEHPFRVIKRQFSHVKVHYEGLGKHMAQLVTLFALSNIWMSRKVPMQRAQG